MKKLILVVTEDKWFLSHRLPLARKARTEGYDVSVVTRVTSYREQIENYGFRVIPLGISRGGMRPLQEIDAIRELISIYRRERPDLVHHIGIKYIIYGTYAANRVGIKHIIAQQLS